MSEIWLRSKQFPKYQVSSLGRVSGPRGILKPSVHTEGYLHVTLMNDDNSKTSIGVHRLVALTFHEDSYFPDAHALHRDHNRKNNVETNIYWGTQIHNVSDNKSNTLSKVKLCLEDAREIRRRAQEGESTSVLAKTFDVTAWTISNIKNGRMWKEPK